jgi:peptidoglycan/LPS O-acetylase OafA/YrhL
VTRIPSLDGIRAVSILFVLLAHGAGTQGFPEILGRATILGNLGVRVFFVLSGFLITRLLMKELESGGAISLRRFYFRRAMRILPAFYAFLAAVAVAAWAGVWDVSSGNLARTAFFLSNYESVRPWHTGHTWSLAVEEQFYLLWPVALATAGLAFGRHAAILAIAAAPFLRMVAWFAFPEWREMVNWAFPTVCDAMAAGCLLACLGNAGGGANLYARFLRSRWFWAVPAAVLIANLAQHSTLMLPLSYAGGQTVMNLGIACAIDRFTRVSGDLSWRLLNARPVAFLGTISYSLYLWQQPFLNRRSDDWWTSFPVNVAFALAAAVASHYLVEKPFLAWRARIERGPQPLAAVAPLGGRLQEES